MNGVDYMIYMQSTNANDGTMNAQGHVRRRDRHQHRPGQHAEPRLAGPAEPAAGRQPVRPDRQEGHEQPAPRRLPLLAEGHLRRALPRQLRDDQRQRRDLPRPGRRPDPELRHRRLRHAHLGQAGSAREPRPDGPRPHQRGAAAEHRQPLGRHRHRAGAEGPGVHLHGALAGAPRLGGGVRQRRRAAEPGRLRGAPEGRQPDRARRAELPAARAPERQARLPDRHLPGPGLQRDRGRRRRQEDDGGAEAAVPGRPRLRGRARHDAAGHRGHQGDRRTPSSRRSSSSSSSCSSSSRAGARR